MDEIKQREAGYRVAAASSDGIVVNQHFGRADTFYIYDIEPESKPQFVEKRNVVPICQEGGHSEVNLEQSIGSLSDCRYVLVSRIGPGAAASLDQAGITPMELPGFIEESIDRLDMYIELQNLLG